MAFIRNCKLLFRLWRKRMAAESQNWITVCFFVGPLVKRVFQTTTFARRQYRALQPKKKTLFRKKMSSDNFIQRNKISYFQFGCPKRTLIAFLLLVSPSTIGIAEETANKFHHPHDNTFFMIFSFWITENILIKDSLTFFSRSHSFTRVKKYMAVVFLCVQNIIRPMHVEKEWNCILAQEAFICPIS